MQRLLRRKYNMTVREAGDGLEGLQIIERELPDIVFLDIAMPLLSGLDTLKAIRSSKNLAALPVIMLTAVKDRGIFKELIQLGISDYILKPIDKESFCDRFQRIYDELRLSLEPNTPTGFRQSSAGTNEVLLVEADSDFARFFSKVQDGHFKVLEASSGAEGFALFVKHQPPIVVIGCNLPLLNERMLAKKIRSLAREVTRIYLLRESRDEAIEDSMFDATIEKSMEPDIFQKNFTDAVRESPGAPDGYRDIISKHLPGEIAKAVNQTFGIMASLDTQILGGDQSRRIKADVAVGMYLASTADRFRLRLKIVCSEADAGSLIRTVLGFAPASRLEHIEMLGEIIHTLAGRLRSAFELFGIRLDKDTAAGDSALDATQLEPGPALAFSTSAGQRFLIQIESGPH